MREILILVILSVIGCKETKGEDPVEVAPPAAPTIALIQSQGCSVSQTGNNVRISCSDGSSAAFTTKPSTYYYPRDANGTDYPALMYAPGGWFNSKTGDLMTYDVNGNLPSLSTVYFTNGNCSGTAYINGNKPSVMGKVYLNQTAAIAQAFKVVGFASGPPILSKFVGNQCLGYVEGSDQTPIIQLQPIQTLDSSDPVTMPAPIQLIMAN